MTIITQANAGQCAAANQALSNANGTFIKFFDADDLLHPEIIERQIPGIAELARLAGIQKSRRAALWRGVVGIKGKTLVVNLPDWETAVAIEAIMPVLPITLKNLSGQ